MNPRFTITETVQTDAHRKSSNAARAARRKANPAADRYKDKPTEFIAIDGEGITLWEGCYTAHAELKYTHRYVLLGVGDDQITNDAGLSWHECFDFLWSRFRTGSVAYVGFFLGYDFVQMLRTLREERARMLLTATGRGKRAPKSDKRRMPFPVECDGWEFDILGSKRLKIRKRGSSRWMSICDTGPFFQKSFLSVINPENWSDPVVTQDEYERIAAGKSRRGVAVLDDDMRGYNRLENDVLPRVLGRLNEGFQALGIHLRPNQWFGPGQAASAWLSGRAITAGRLGEVVPRAALEAARASYYGGWFEIMAHGIVPGVTWEYDINSAYPHIIRSLPCLEHGKWEHHEYYDPGNYDPARLTLVRAAVSNTDRYVGSMLHRDDSGNISRPDRTEGWYWLDELDAAYRATNTVFHAFESWTYDPCGCPPPLAEVAGIYDMRLRVGKRTPLGMACKLVPNSLYGKFAQSVGAPEYGNPVYASRITSGTRAMILNAIASHPGGTGAVLMVATDGVYFRTPHPSLPLSSQLGDWEDSGLENLTLFKPGVYWDDATREAIRVGEAAVFKARGVNPAAFSRSLDAIDQRFAAMACTRPQRITWPRVDFPIGFSMVTCVQALARGKWDTAGTLIPEPTARQSSDPSLKRSAWHWDGPLLRSRPPANDPYEPSRPYKKRFGMADPWSDESREADGVGPEGYPGDLWKEALYG